MEKKTDNNKGNVIGKVLRRPIVRIALILVVAIVAIIIIDSNDRQRYIHFDVNLTRDCFFFSSFSRFFSSCMASCSFSYSIHSFSI